MTFVELLPYIIIIITVSFVVCFFLLLNNPYKNYEKKLKHELETKKLSDPTFNYALQKVSNENYHFVLTISDQKYLIFLLSVPPFSEIIVNNKTTWELRYGAGLTPGKLQPHRSYIPEIKKFMNFTTPDKKIVVVYPKAKKIAKYINECEMVIVSDTTDVYGVNIINDSTVSFFTDENK